MAFLIMKYFTTAFVIVLVSEVAKRSDKLGALISSLPFVTIMVMIWLYIEKQGNNKIANHAFYTFCATNVFINAWLMAKGFGLFSAFL